MRSEEQSAAASCWTPIAQSSQMDFNPTLLEGTIEDNITMGQPSISYGDVRWALHFLLA